MFYYCTLHVTMMIVALLRDHEVIFINSRVDVALIH